MSSLGARASQLRADFAASFAEEAGGTPSSAAAMFSVEVAGAPYAVLASAIAGLHRDRRIVPVPEGPPGLMGLCSLHGDLLPVWDLGILLGYGGVSHPGPWMLLPASTVPWALAFERFEGHLSTSENGLLPYSCAGPSAKFCREAVMDRGRQRPLLDLGDLLVEIRSRIDHARQRSQG